MKVILLGGEYRDAQRDFCGYITERAVSALRFTKCFIGVDGYSADDGLLADDFSTAGINRLVTQNCLTAYCLPTRQNTDAPPL